MLTGGVGSCTIGRCVDDDWRPPSSSIHIVGLYVQEIVIGIVVEDDGREAIHHEQFRVLARGRTGR